MIRFRIRCTRRHRTIIEDADLAVIDAYWERHHRIYDGWLIQWKDAEAPACADPSSAAWAEPPLAELTRRRLEAAACRG